MEAAEPSVEACRHFCFSTIQRNFMSSSVYFSALIKLPRLQKGSPTRTKDTPENTFLAYNNSTV